MRLTIEEAVTIVEEAIIRWANEPSQTYSSQGNWQAYEAKEQAVNALRAANIPEDDWDPRISGIGAGG